MVDGIVPPNKPVIVLINSPQIISNDNLAKNFQTGDLATGQDLPKKIKRNSLTMILI
jgi:hypothetical protein